VNPAKGGYTGGGGFLPDWKTLEPVVVCWGSLVLQNKRFTTGAAMSENIISIPISFSSTTSGLKKAAFFKGFGSVICLNAQTDFRGLLPTLRFSDQEVLGQDARQVADDIWAVLQG